MRLRYRRRRDALVRELRRQLPGLEVRGLAAGQQLLEYAAAPEPSLRWAVAVLAEAVRAAA